jgi:drug/metabolite transporter (DMT)-like permease
MTEAPSGVVPVTHRPVTAGAALFTVALSVLFGANPTAIKRGLDYVEPLQIGYMRFALAGVMLVLWALVTRRPMVPRRNEVLPLLLLVATFVGTIAATNFGQDRTSASHSVVILTTFPIWTAILAHLFVRGDRMGRAQVAGVALSYAGVVATFAPSLGEGGAQLQGDILILLASFFLGCSQIVIAVIATRIEISKIVLAQVISAVVILFIASVAVEGTDYDLQWPLGISLLYQGVLVGGIGFISNAWLLKTFLPSRISVIYATQPFFGMFASHFVLGEDIEVAVIAGVILVSLGILVMQEAWTAVRRPQAKPA